MRLWRSLLILGCLSTTINTILAQSQPSLTNIIQSDGSVKALYESQAVVTTQFWLFHTNHTRVDTWETLGNGTSTFQRRGNLNPGTVTTSTQVSNNANGTTITMQATPSREVLSNSDHMNIMFDEAFWAGATFSDGIQSFTFSPNFTQGFARTGWGKTFTITRPDGFRLTITTPQNVIYGAQDSRGYHLGFELRFDSRNGTWPANTTKTYGATFKYTNASTTTPDAQVVIGEGNDWRPLQQSMSVMAGSALDWQDKFAPIAGSKGWLTVNSSGKFVFPSATTQPLRFYGANLAHYACFGSHNQSKALADNLARLGYNAVRLHHIDAILTNANGNNSTTIDPVRMEELNYLINELKKRGIYISIDLHSIRKPRQNEIISGYVNENDYKALLLVSPAARQNLLTYATNLLNTHNPYTGLKWKDDPAIAWISIGNENTPFWMRWPRSDIKTMLDNAVGGNWNPTTELGSKAAVNLASDTAEYFATQLRGIGVRSLFTNMNAGFERALAIGRSELDYVDNHMYFAHPNGFTVPLTQNSRTPLRKVEEIGWFASSRLKGKAFTVTEFDGVSPNQFRAEYGLMVGAMGVVQQWDGMWRFQFADNMDRALNLQAMGLFSLAGDPLNMATERAIVAMFLRGDLTNPDAPYNIANPFATANQNEIREEAIVRQSILTKAMAQINGSGSNGTGVVYTGQSSTPNGQVTADLNNLNLKISTSNTASVIGSEGSTMTTTALTAKFTKSRASIYLTTVDKKPLASSRRMLLAHLTDVQNSGATFTGKERDTLTSWGTLPHLVKVGTAEVTVQVQYPDYMKVYRLDLAGRRLSTVPFSKLTRAIKFDISTRDPQNGNGVIYYELVSSK